MRTLVILCTIFVNMSAAFASADESYAWYFDLDGYELVYTFTDSGVKKGDFISHRYFKAISRNDWISWDKVQGRCTHHAEMNLEDISKPVVLKNTNEKYEAFILNESGKLQAYIQNRITGEVLVGEDVFEKASQMHRGIFELSRGVWVSPKRCIQHFKH